MKSDWDALSTWWIFLLGSSFLLLKGGGLVLYLISLLPVLLFYLGHHPSRPVHDGQPGNIKRMKDAVILVAKSILAEVYGIYHEPFSLKDH